MTRKILSMLALASFGCGTLATEAGDSDAPRPNAQAGPFRLLGSDEIDGLDAPYVLKKKFWDFREPSVHVSDSAVRLGEAVMYAVATDAGTDAIFRFVAPDGRSFDKVPAPAAGVLTADAAGWEGGQVDTPESAELGDELWLFYSAAGGIGAARSSDGIVFEKLGLVLGPGGAAWEAGGVPRAPSFLSLGAGDYRLFYEVDGQIGEARSSDGTSWERLGEEPVLAKGPDAAGEPAFDGSGVGDPEVVRAKSAEGRVTTRVYYTGLGADGTSAIGLAARFGDDGPLTRAAAPAFASTRLPRAPAVVSYADLSLLFVTERSGVTDEWPAIAAGIAPATLRIPVE
ncbi:MAG: hypothetical protein IPI67_19000 [Myxococcales bacterium]|nr:hypothetical protein [Myxococcales bacterium]